MKNTLKTAKTVKPYSVKFNGYSLTVPIGSTVTNQTAAGFDDNYRFWTDYHCYVKDLTGFHNSLLAHDLKYYGLNIPGEYCEPYGESILANN